MISKGVDALAINLVDPAAAGTIIAKAKEAKYSNRVLQQRTIC